MPDIPPNGSAQGQPDFEPSPATPSTPRIAPPAGTRAARGESLEDDAPTVSGEIDAPSLDAPSLDAPSLDAPSLDAPSFDAPSVEDSYEPPFGDETLETEPPDDAPLSNLGGGARPDTPKDVELGLLQHLTELRQRLLYCALILIGGMAVTWNYSQQLQKWFSDPIKDVIAGKGILQSTDPTGFFSITVQFSMVSALILTAPLLFWQVWRFIEPALTHSERRYSLIIVPFSSVLFFLGAALAYAVSPLFFKFFLAFQLTGVAANWDYYSSILLMAKMLLAFGIMFQVPVIVIFLNKIGLLSRNVLIEYWRHAVVAIFTVAAVVTPTWDPVSLAVCATPPCLLYILSIWLVKWL